MKKTKRSYKLLILATFAALFQTCVNPVEFDRRDEDDILVVDGRVNLNDSIQTLLLTRTGPLGRSARFPTETGATVTLIENDKTVGTYVEEEPGVYKIYHFKPQIGNSYHIDIQLQNGDHYTSLPETMPRPVFIESAYFTYNGDRTLTLFSSIKIPEQDDPPYLRWKIKHVYQRTDLACGFFDNTSTCYYETNRATDNQLVPLLDGGELKPGTVIEFSITDVPVIDTIFGEVTYFTVFQETLTPAAFQYWEKVNTLLSQTGSIFDAPPGQIRGNIYKTDDANALVLGLFYATSEEIAYVKTFPGDFAPLDLAPFCGVPGVPPTPFPYPECCYCPFGIPRPDYW
ncbi:MAG: DUF4249 domain-containing protein [Saprospiraceae bacterium]|nr:DUF4249 domain-containing protein [Saprospiraceae bacterium]